MPPVAKTEVQKTERPSISKAIYNNPKLRGQLTISPVKTVTDVSFNAILVLFFIIKIGGMEHLSILQEYY